MSKDIIYRQSVIDYLNELLDGRFQPHEEAIIEGIRDNVELLPSAQQWTPCSERPPEEMGTYMTTVEYGKHGLAVGQRYYCGKYLGWEDECVIAWMPLPEPYKEGQE